ncbi:MAG: hypothetical protein HYY16_17245, partial [Planctomycetes bacterium]|nr:hypothetical protein [Planctomycetota bacterium]
MKKFLRTAAAEFLQKLVVAFRRILHHVEGSSARPLPEHRENMYGVSDGREISMPKSRRGGRIRRAGAAAALGFVMNNDTVGKKSACSALPAKHAEEETTDFADFADREMIERMCACPTRFPIREIRAIRGSVFVRDLSMSTTLPISSLQSPISSPEISPAPTMPRMKLIPVVAQDVKT